MSFEDALRHYRSYSHYMLTSMLNYQSYLYSLSDNQRKGLFAAWEEYYYAV